VKGVSALKHPIDEVEETRKISAADHSGKNLVLAFVKYETGYTKTEVRNEVTTMHLLSIYVYV
jgi:hypothetical protein